MWYWTVNLCAPDSCCSKIISELYFLLCDNCFYLLFHAVPFEIVPMRLDAGSPVTVAVLVVFAEIPCFDLGRCSLWLFSECDYVNKYSKLSFTKQKIHIGNLVHCECCPVGPEINWHNSTLACQAADKAVDCVTVTFSDFVSTLQHDISLTSASLAKLV
jgi:hypothetical protein